MAQLTDRDLLVVEPHLFRDVVFVSQTPANFADATVMGTSLVSLTADFVLAGVTPGMVAVIDGVSIEILERLSATALVVSRPRANLADAPLPPTGGTALKGRVATFGPQIRAAELALRRDLGLSESGASIEGYAAIMDAGMFRAGVYGALSLIFSAAAAGSDATDPLWARARRYDQDRQRELRLLRLAFDTNGDGAGDLVRRTQPSRMVRE